MAKISKILYIVTQSEWGGAQKYVFDLATNLSPDQYEVAVASGGHDELFIKLDEKKVKSYKLKNLVRQINPIKDIKAYFEIKKLIKEIKPDILHLNSSKAGVIGAIAGKHTGVKKIIYTVHGFVFNEPMASWQKIIYIWAEKFSAKYKDKLICVSEFDRQIGIKNQISDENKFVTINNGILKLNFLLKDEAKKELALPLNNTIIGTIANFYPTKGLTYLTQAAKIVTEKYPNTFFRIIGFGQLKNQLDDEVKKLKLGDKLLIDKIETKDGGYKYLLAFDIYTLPSVKEGFPFAILEAMQAGLPIIATSVGGIPEMIINGTNGLLVPPADPQALAEAIIKLLENKELAKKFGDQAKIDVAQNFSLEKMIAKTSEIY